VVRWVWISDSWNFRAGEREWGLVGAGRGASEGKGRGRGWRRRLLTRFQFVSLLLEFLEFFSIDASNGFHG
jgi:hypothetical protein